MESTKKALSVKAGNRIRYFRMMKKLSQEELAGKSGINPVYLSQMERGVKCPTIDSLNKICISLNITLSQLLDFESDLCANEKSNALEKIIAVVKSLSKADADRIADIVAEIVKINQDKP